MKRWIVLTLAAFIPLIPACAKNGKAMTPDQALQRLMDGNQRFVNEKTIHPNVSAELHAKLKEGQTPFAVIVGCADSRVSPELVFDQGLGDLFVVRVAGNVVGPLEMASVEFAADKLLSSVILVVGHEKCGAIDAALKGSSSKGDLGALYPLLQAGIKDRKDDRGNPLYNAIVSNVEYGVEAIKNNPVIAKLMKQNRVSVVGGYYDFDEGKVTLVTK